MSNKTNRGPNIFIGPLKENETVEPKYFAVVDANNRLKKASGAAGEQPRGRFFSDKQQLHAIDSTKKTGDADGTVEWTTESGFVIEGLTITGSTKGDEGRFVWAIDEDSLTLTPQDGVAPHGIVHQWESESEVYVYLYQPHEIALMTSGVSSDGVRTIIQRIAGEPLEDDTKKVASSIKMSGAFKVLSVRAVCVNAGSPAAGTRTASLEIGSDAVTGGAIALSNGDTQGLTIDGSAITAENTGDAGDELKVVIDSGGTGFTASHRSEYEVQIDVLQNN